LGEAVARRKDNIVARDDHTREGSNVEVATMTHHSWRCTVATLRIGGFTVHRCRCLYFIFVVPLDLAITCADSLRGYCDAPTLKKEPALKKDG
jgi:hypothetical protein